MKNSGVVSYSTNLNTANLLRQMLKTDPRSGTSPLRILLETDAPYMIPANLYASLTSPDMKGKRLPLCHTGMIPWTAEFVAGVLKNAYGDGCGADETIKTEYIDNEEKVRGTEVDSKWDAERVMQIARDNARSIYGV